MAIGLRVYDPTTRKVIMDPTTTFSAKLLGTITGNGSLTLPRATSQYYFLLESRDSAAAFDAYSMGTTEVTFNLSTLKAIVSGATSNTVTYIGEL